MQQPLEANLNQYSLGEYEIVITFLNICEINKSTQTSIWNINEFMRPHFLSKNKINVYRSQDEYFPTFIKGQRAAAPFNSSKNVKHIRSSSNLLEDGNVNSLNIQTNNQQLFLPKIRELSTKQQNIAGSKSIDQLQVYVHHLLLKNLKQHKENKQIKSLEIQIDKKKVDLTKKQEQIKKQKDGTRLQQLRSKLTQLYGQMALEQNKLKIQYNIQEKMEKKFTNLYQHIAKRFKRTDMVDTAQNTQISTNIEGKNREKNPNRKKILSRFRVIGFTVLFAVFFPKYSNSFKLERKKYFYKIINQQNQLEIQLNNCHRLFEEIKLKSFWKKLENKSGQQLSSINSQANSLQSNNNSEQQINALNNYKIFQSLKFILQTILQAIKLGKIDQLLKISSLSLSNRSYLTDQLFLSAQLKNIKIDKINNLIILDKIQQKILIGNLLMIKLTAFSFMMNNSIVSKNSQQYIFQNKQNGKYNNLTFTIAKYLQIAGLYLIDLCNQSIFMQKQSAQSQNYGNLNEVQQQLLPLPMPQLKFESKKIIRSDKSLQQRTSIQQIIKNSGINQEGIQILNCDNIRKIMKKIPQQIQNTLLQLIQDIKQEAYVKFKEFKRMYYEQFSDLALINIKNQQINMNQNKVIRSPQELKILHQLHLYLNKDILQNNNIILQSQKQDEISQESNDSQSKRVNNRRSSLKNSQSKEPQSR